jgi:hypothetical protein
MKALMSLPAGDARQGKGRAALGALGIHILPNCNRRIVRSGSVDVRCLGALIPGG